MLEKLLRSKAEVRVLGIALFEDGLHLREIARRAGVSPFEAKKELDNLVSIGVLQSEKKGNLQMFHSDRHCPFFSDLKNLYQKTEGIFYQLRDAMKGVKNIDYAFVYGSTAAGMEKKSSDIDLMVIGLVDENDVARRIFRKQRMMKREINYVVWSPADLKEKIENKSVFLNNLVKGKLVFISGDKDEFVRTVEKGRDKKNRS